MLFTVSNRGEILRGSTYNSTIQLPVATMLVNARKFRERRVGHRNNSSTTVTLSTFDKNVVLTFHLARIFDRLSNAFKMAARSEGEVFFESKTTDSIATNARMYHWSLSSIHRSFTDAIFHPSTALHFSTCFGQSYFWKTWLTDPVFTEGFLLPFYSPVFTIIRASVAALVRLQTTYLLYDAA